MKEDTGMEDMEMKAQLGSVAVVGTRAFLSGGQLTYGRSTAYAKVIHSTPFDVNPWERVAVAEVESILGTVEPEIPASTAFVSIESLASYPNPESFASILSESLTAFVIAADSL